jgi:hypothetical protein
VAVGKTDEFRKSLATLGLPVSSIDLTIPEPKPSESKRAQQAVGGAEKLAGVKDRLEGRELHVNPPWSPLEMSDGHGGFEEVDGTKVPNRMTILQKGSKYADVVVISIRIDTGLKSEDQSKKP